MEITAKNREVPAIIDLIKKKTGIDITPAADLIEDTSITIVHKVDKAIDPDGALTVSITVSA